MTITRLHATLALATAATVGVLAGQWTEPAHHQTTRHGFLLACTEDEIAAPMTGDHDGLRWECVHVDELHGVQYRG